MCHGHHALLEINEETDQDYLNKLLYTYKTEVDPIYFDEENIEGEELQKSYIYDSCDF